ncbi:hypothetical protein G9U51_07930 [Calidifontibacter sp. DB0510]|uniref:DUF4352 domain-containing protein n=1 Tax=Metallococcus carri TaxID=1656884 RepID=A0A967AZT4_9MICO|nr:hypothetical protein [Metallococcus carri]NHN55703.1 hypothetical protein [Metallococcus carri]NOP38608.1 hypothetical protein [Calidifontibacter sp. DB2511S]
MTSRRVRSAAVACAVAALSACSSPGAAPSSTSVQPTPTSATNCAGGKAPAYRGGQTAYDAPAPVEQTKALEAQASEPAMTSTPSRREGYRIAQVKVSAKVRTNGIFGVEPGNFVLVDGSGKRCEQPATNPLPNAFSVLQVDEATTGSGTVAFLVPAEANLSDYTVYYLPRPDASTATAAWSGSGTAPTVATQTACSTTKSQVTSDGVTAHDFGTPFTAGDSVVSQVVTPSKPTMRTLPPSAKQPNDVTGVAIDVTVQAKGAEGFVERSQFELIDTARNRCGYSALGSDGETLTNALVPKDKSQKFTLIFWTPKGSTVHSWMLLYVPDPKSRKATAAWWMKTGQ